MFNNKIVTFINTIKAKRIKKKMEDELYMQYVKNAIREAEDDIANGGKTYTLEEYLEILRDKYEVNL